MLMSSCPYKQQNNLFNWIRFSWYGPGFVEMHHVTNYSGATSPRCFCAAAYSFERDAGRTHLGLCWHTVKGSPPSPPVLPCPALNLQTSLTYNRKYSMYCSACTRWGVVFLPQDWLRSAHCHACAEIPNTRAVLAGEPWAGSRDTGASSVKRTSMTPLFQTSKIWSVTRHRWGERWWTLLA